MGQKSIVRDIDKGWDAIMGNLAELTSKDVYVGIHSTAHRDESGELTAAAIGAVHEFGDPDNGIPQRKWLRAGIDHNRKAIGIRYGELFKIATSPSGNVRRGLNRLGMFGVTGVRNYMRTVGQHVWPDITDATKLAKGSTKILRDSGQLVRGITHTVRLKGATRDEGTIISDGTGDNPTPTIPGTLRKTRSLQTIKGERRRAKAGRKRSRIKRRRPK